MGVVEAVLSTLELQPGDIVCDLGSGDGRFLIAAARHEGVRALGVEADPKLVAVTLDAAVGAGVADRVEARCGDLLLEDFSDATVVILYLVMELHAQLVPKLQALRPGTRVVAIAFPIPGVTTASVYKVLVPEEPQPIPIYQYVVPLQPAH